MKTIVRSFPKSLRSTIRSTFDSFPVGQFITQSYYRGIKTQLRYSLADASNRKQFSALNKYLPEHQIAISPGLTLCIHPEARNPFEHFADFDPELVEEMQSFMRLTAGKTCLLDIGAHYGIFSLVFAGNPDSMAFAIEPSVSAYEILTYHQKANPNRLIKPFQIAFGEKSGTLKMQYASTHLVHLTPLNVDLNEDTLEIDVVTVDSFVDRQGIKPDVIKIDVEGFELPVLKGALNVLSTYSPLIFLEVHTSQEKYIADYLVKDLVDFLYSLGYRFYDTSYRSIESPLKFLRILRRIICSKEEL
jgi:FkbM family methyltransferase